MTSRTPLSPNPCSKLQKIVHIPLKKTPTSWSTWPRLIASRGTRPDSRKSSLQPTFPVLFYAWFRYVYAHARGRTRKRENHAHHARERFQRKFSPAWLVWLVGCDGMRCCGLISGLDLDICCVCACGEKIPAEFHGLFWWREVIHKICCGMIWFKGLERVESTRGWTISK